MICGRVTADFNATAKVQNTGPLISVSLNNKTCYCLTFRPTKASENLHVLALCGLKF